MPSQTSAILLGDNMQSVAYILAGVVAATVVFSKLSASRKLDKFPTVGSTVSPFSWLKDSTKLIHEGYVKHKTAPFKIANGFTWVIVLGNRKQLEEAESAPEDVIRRFDSLNTRHTIGAKETSSNSLTHLTMSRLNRNLSNLFDDIRDEVLAAFDELLDLKENEWKIAPTVAAIQQIICRTSNRVFVGLPLCRNPSWTDLNLRFTLDIANGGFKLWMVPDFLAPLVVKYMTEIPRSIERGMELLAPIIQERRRLMNEHGKDWTGKPNDVLSWLLDAEPNATVRLTTIHILSINFVAIHTSSSSFTHALFYLAQYPEYTQPLRDEVESIVTKEGWSKASMGKMHKLDSFLKECQRLAGILTTTLLRETVKDLTLSDGTTLPKGVLITGPAREFHRDDEVYSDAHEFKPFRFIDMQNDGESVAKHQFTWTNSVDYWPFGHGKHTCPGRFFAITEFKTMLAHIIMSYDVKLEDSHIKPKEFIAGNRVVPDPTVKIMFRRRAL